MIKKYDTVKKDVIEYIHNRLKAGATPDMIVSEVTTKYPTFVAFYKCDPDMIQEFIYWIADVSYFYQNGKFYGEAVPAGVDAGADTHHDSR